MTSRVATALGRTRYRVIVRVPISSSLRRYDEAFLQKLPDPDVHMRTVKPPRTYTIYLSFSSSASSRALYSFPLRWVSKQHREAAEKQSTL